MREDASETLTPEEARRWTVGICAFTGAWGVLTGFAIFILLHASQNVDALTLWLGLASAALASLVVEFLRGAAGGEVAVAGPLRSRLPQIVITLLTLAVFELFVLAAHTAAEIFRDPSATVDLRDAILGPALESAPGATRDLLILALLWTVSGASVGAALGYFVARLRQDLPERRLSLRAAATGVAVGGIVAPLAVMSYILAWRLALALRLALFDREELMRRLLAFMDPGAIVYAPQPWYGFALSIFLNISTLWMWAVVGKIAVGLLLAATLAVGLRWKLWWPLWTVVVILLAGIVAPFISDAADLARLPVLAAIVWVVPGAGLGLAAPLLQRPAAHSLWWSAIAAVLAVSIAAATLLYQQDFRYLLLAFLFLALAGLFAVSRDVQELWPAKAFCLAVAVSGFSFAAIPLTPSFHEVLEHVSRINAIPARFEPYRRRRDWTDDVRFLDGAGAAQSGGWYSRQLIDAFAGATLAQRLEILRAAKAHLLEDRREALGRLPSLAAEKQRELGGRKDVDEFYHSLDDVAAMSEDDLQHALFEEWSYALDWEGVPFWKSYAEAIDDLRSRVVSLRVVEEKLPEMRAQAERQEEASQLQRRWLAEGVAQKLEVALTGSTAFWVTAGLIGAWALRRRVGGGSN